MKKRFWKILALAIVLAMASRAYCLNIMPTWDSSITNDPNAAAITNGIMFAIQTFESNITDNLTVKIYFQEMSSGLGQSDTYYYSVSYSSYLTALKNSATSVNDSNALRQLPNISTDPVVGNSQINLQFPQAHLFGFYPGYEGTDGYDSTISLNTSIMNFTRPPGNPSKYDLIATAEHEIDEVLGFVSTLPDYYPSGPIGPMDLFRYATNLVPSLVLTRTYTTSGDNAFFSVDGTNLLARFNQMAGGDYHDFWSFSALWAPPGVTPFHQVQDAYAHPDTTPNLGSNELAGLDIVGYTLAVPPPILKIAPSGKNKFTLSWSGGGSGYMLQENTNLLAPSTWVNSVTGTTNPATIVSTNIVKFYRLYKLLPPAPLFAQNVMFQTTTNVVFQKVRHVYNPN